MSRRLKLAAGLGLAFLVLGADALAQAEKPLPPRQKLRENMATLRLLRLTQALDLSEEQAARIFPTINRIEKEKLEHQRNMSADLRDLRQLLRDPSPREAEIEGKVAKIREAQKGVRDKDAEVESFLANNLTTVQKAKYLLFQIEFYRLMEQSLERLRLGRNGLAPAPVKK